MPFIKKHWNLDYLKSKIKQKRNLKSEPFCPWLAFESVKFLKQYIKQNDIILEIGSGNSTIWFAQKIQHLYSVESNPIWHEKISKIIAEQSLKNVSYYLEIVNNHLTSNQPYIERIYSFPNEYFDIILIDGKLRDQCAIASLDKIKSNGLIIIDNVERYIYDETKIPGKLNSPEYETHMWKDFIDKTKYLRKVTFYDGISSTMLIFNESK